MLVLSRKQDESVIVDGDITIRVLGINGSRVQIGIDAPRCKSIQRAELELDAQLTLNLAVPQNAISQNAVTTDSVSC